ncbi:Thiol-specific monooxygenase [Grifola frondosa]|uniref:Thiol-specific monooxygenase n=1 Tax=Grifola frondosa TaxID=5627 RepID=A0A1C7LSE7_GRIFR|nr:Thiol-specific monooxygenase [Grifola frondosa]
MPFGVAQDIRFVALQLFSSLGQFEDLRMDLLPNAALETSRAAAGVKQICIIGAGPGGLGALKVIADTPQFKEGLWKVTAFEARDKIGGIWVPAPPTGYPPLTPLYDSLTTNLAHPAMAYRSFSFPPSTTLFPRASIVEAYLNAYAETFGLIPHIRLNTAVLSLSWDDTGSQWVVRLSGDETLRFDLVIVANGHYRLPRFPNTPGLDTWREKGKATHSAWYRRPQPFGTTVLVVGAGPSGQDIVAETRTVTHTVVRSISGAATEDFEGGTLKIRGRVKEYLDADDGRVVFEDGTVETGIDHVILATGYQFDFPFFSQSVVHTSLPPPVPPLPSSLFNSSYHLFPLARHISPLTSHFPPSSLAFVGLPLHVAPFPLVEAQTRAVLKVFQDPASLDVAREAVGIISRYEALRAVAGDDELAIAESWHRFVGHEQFDYRDELHAFAGGEFAGAEWKVPQWEKEVYDWKEAMKVEWKEIERAGEAEKLVRGVGAGSDGDQEWVDLLMKVLRRAKDRADRTKL